MPSDFPRSPRLMKGALLVFSSPVPVPDRVIVFQYNPENVGHKLENQQGNSDPAKGSGATQNVPRAPTETFTVNIELDAADQLEQSSPLAIGLGLHPTLAALELLLYPPSTLLILNKALSLIGSSLISPPKLPTVLFAFGPARVIPVRVAGVNITELAFDPHLNPILARVELQLRTMTDQELGEAGTVFQALNIVRQIEQEALARTSAFATLDNLSSLLPF
jgi:hypothetical protein